MFTVCAGQASPASYKSGGGRRVLQRHLRARARQADAYKAYDGVHRGLYYIHVCIRYLALHRSFCAVPWKSHTDSCFGPGSSGAQREAAFVCTRISSIRGSIRFGLFFHGGADGRDYLGYAGACLFEKKYSQPFSPVTHQLFLFPGFFPFWG